jgi:acyl-CoA synthetase (AMP-forming)/AMP-acid ligase II
MNIGTLFPRHAKYRPDHLAFVFEDQRLTWLELNKSINRLANTLLGLGVKKGDKVATILPNCLESFETIWAVTKIGAVVVPLSALLLEQAMKSLLQDSDTVLLITSSSFVNSVDAIKPELPAISENCYLLTDSSDTPGYQDYHALKASIVMILSILCTAAGRPVCPKGSFIPIISGACTQVWVPPPAV